MKTRLSLLFCLAAAGVLAEIAPMQPIPTHFASLNEHFSVGERFVPANSQIEAVSVYLRAPREEGEIQLSIRKEWHKKPLGEARVQASKIPTPDGWVTFRFEPPLIVPSGEPLFLRLDCTLPAAASAGAAFARDYFFDLYPDGKMTTCWMRGVPKTLENADLSFKIFSSGEAKKVASGDGKQFFVNIDYSDNFNLDWAGPNGFGGIRNLTPQEEIRETMRQLKKIGVDGVLWRTHAGCELYRTKLGTVFTEKHAKSRHDKKMVEAIKTCDPLAEAVKYAHEFGLKIYAWTLLNDDGKTPSTVNDFLKKNPQLQWCSRDGKYLSGVPCYAFPEVRAYRLGLIEELMSYGVDGVFMSTRSHTTGFGENVLLQYGFNPPVAEAFRQRYGVDILTDFKPERDGARLIRLRAELMNDFYREVKAMRDRKYPQVKIAADLSHLPQDWPEWIREGLVDDLMVNAVSGNYGITPFAEEYRDIADLYADAVSAMSGSARVMMWIQMVNYKRKTMHSGEQLYLDILYLGRSRAGGGVLHEHCSMMKAPDDFEPYIKRALHESWRKKQ